MARPRAIFFGSPAFAVPCLDATTRVADVVAVVTQPDRPAGRGMALRRPPVKARALEHGLDVLQPTKVRTGELADRLAALGADVGVVVAYGRILPRAVLNAPRLGCVNVHASLLPRWRGAAPVHWAIVHGDEETGVCLMQMDEGMDTGPVLCCERTPIDPNETAGRLAERLSSLGASVLERELPRFLAGELEASAQPDTGVTVAPVLRKEHGRIDWTRSAREVHDLVRGMSPWPGAFATMEGSRVKVHRTHVVDRTSEIAPPGTLVRAEGDALHVACGRGVVAVDELQAEGRKRLGARQFLAGHGWSRGARFDVEAGRGGMAETGSEGE
ncbi:MAG: methionyl-tRNA formyltransferase [Myxococcota bacterium]